MSRKIKRDSDGREAIVATCPKGHTFVAPNKGLGRANVAAWETRHQNCEQVYGMCTACGAAEVALNRATGRRDLSRIGEAVDYPTGFGCEVCF